MIMGSHDALTFASCQSEVAGIFTSGGVMSDVQLENFAAKRELGEWRKWSVARWLLSNHALISLVIACVATCRWKLADPCK